jgi:hypothetical protein
MLWLVFWRDTTALIFLAGGLGDGFGPWLESAHVDPLLQKILTSIDKVQMQDFKSARKFRVWFLLVNDLCDEFFTGR